VLIVGAGAIIGELSLLLGSPPLASAFAVDEVRVYVIDAATLREVCRHATHMVNTTSSLIGATVVGVATGIGVGIRSTIVASDGSSTGVCLRIARQRQTSRN
jgi:hypothetical protein